MRIYIEYFIEFSEIIYRIVDFQFYFMQPSGKSYFFQIMTKAVPAVLSLIGVVLSTVDNPCHQDIRSR